ncbi:MAG: hypothetical protein PHR15_04325 [Atopobiaceae bacterium]|nr:hypothetical protein [Atopobiaceae bacterium]
MAQVVYEPTSWGDDLGRRLAAGEVVLGEICRCNGDAAWQCNDCGLRFGHDGGPAVGAGGEL